MKFFGRAWYWFREHMPPCHTVVMTCHPPNEFTIEHDGIGWMRFVIINSKEERKEWYLWGIDTLEVTFTEGNDGTTTTD